MNNADDDLTTAWTIPATTSPHPLATDLIGCFIETYTSESKKGWSSLYIIGISGGCLAILFLLLTVIAVRRARRSKFLQMDDTLLKQPPGAHTRYYPTVTVHPLKADHHHLMNADTQPPPYLQTAPPYTAAGEVLPSFQEVVRDT